MHKLSDCERTALSKALHERGELFFPVSFVVTGAIAGSFIRMQRLGSRYKPTFRERIFARMFESYRCITDFIYKFGPQELHLETEYKGDEEGLRVYLKTNSAGQSDEAVE